MRVLLLFFLFYFGFVNIAFNQSGSMLKTWILSETLKSKDGKVEITGSPSIVECKYGKAVEFNGKSDGIYVDEMPLKELKEFTVEAIIKPYREGNFEQRFLHIGEANGSRILLEIRTTNKNWYFDAFIKAGEQNKALIDSTLLHPLDKWYHVAFVIDNGILSSYVNGEKELEYNLDMDTTIDSGKISMGTRMDKRSWFKGTIYKVRITPIALTPEHFIEF